MILKRAIPSTGPIHQMESSDDLRVEILRELSVRASCPYKAEANPRCLFGGAPVICVR
jgi:hypothetical protein